MFGDEPVTLQQALELMGDLNNMEELESQIRQALRTNDATKIDADEIGNVLGDEARRFAKELQRLTKELEEAGFIRRKGQGWELTPRLYARLATRRSPTSSTASVAGTSATTTARKSGIGVELTDETKKWGSATPSTSTRSRPLATPSYGRGRARQSASGPKTSKSTAPSPKRARLRSSPST